MDPLDRYVRGGQDLAAQGAAGGHRGGDRRRPALRGRGPGSAAGRGLDETELRALLERRGHPMWLAEAYLPRQYLIGPVLLPIYRRVVKVAVGAIAAIFAVLYLVFGVFARDVVPRLAPAGLGFWLWQFVLWALAYVGLITMIFAAIERTQAAARRRPLGSRAPAGLAHGARRQKRGRG